MRTCRARRGTCASLTATRFWKCWTKSSTFEFLKSAAPPLNPVTFFKAEKTPLILPTRDAISASLATSSKNFTLSSSVACLTFFRISLSSIFISSDMSPFASNWTRNLARCLMSSIVFSEIFESGGQLSSFLPLARQRTPGPTPTLKVLLRSKNTLLDKSTRGGWRQSM